MSNDEQRDDQDVTEGHAVRGRPFDAGQPLAETADEETEGHAIEPRGFGAEQPLGEGDEPTEGHAVRGKV